MLINMKSKDWKDLAPILHKMTEEEKQWYATFLKGFNKGHVESLRQLTDNEVLIEEIRREAVRRGNQGHRNVTTLSRKTRYEFADYDLSDAASRRSPEAAVIEAIDALKRWGAAPKSRSRRGS